MSSQEDFLLPALDADGRIDRLTGLDAPEIFYRFLEKAIFSKRRDPSHSVALVRVRLGLESLRMASFGVSNSGLAFRVAQLAGILQSQTRSDEHLVRIGEVTFLILARVSDSNDLEAMRSRLVRALADLKFNSTENGETVDRTVAAESESGLPLTHQSIEEEIDGYRFEISVDSFLHKEGEEMLELLERAGV